MMASVKRAIQRRTIYLEPPTGMDMLYVSRQFENPEIRAMFAYGDDIQPYNVRQAHHLGAAVVGIIKRVEDRRRVGFMYMVGPALDRDYWESLGAIPDVRHRDAYSMLHAVDIITHYLFDHMGVERCGSRVRADNKASLAVAKRLGYRIDKVEEWAGHDHVIHLLDRAKWLERKARLEEGERQHPSGLGAAFVTLPGPPYAPIPVTLKRPGDATPPTQSGSGGTG